MGNTGAKFRKALISGDEDLASQIYEGNPQFRESLDPNASYGEPYQHNTPLHYASRHAMVRLLRCFLLNKDGNPNKRNVRDEVALHLLCMGPRILLPEGVLSPRVAQPLEDERRRLDCIRVVLQWTGARLDHGEYERADINAADDKRNTCLHYAAASGMGACVELLVKSGADLFAENEDRETPCDAAEARGHRRLALSLESLMVFSGDPEGVEDEYADLDRGELYEGLGPQDLRRLKDVLIVETADMLQVPLFPAEALLRAHDWDREKLLEAWMSGAESCCRRSGVQMPAPPPRGYNAWDTLPSPRNPRTAPSSATSPDDLSPPGTEESTSCGICMCTISEFEEPVDMPCGHEFCRACWEGFLNLKIQEGVAHGIRCPAHDCFQLVPVEIIESVVSREMDRRYLQFDIKAFVENNPLIRWCPRAGCERAVRLSHRGPDSASSEPPPPQQAPAVDCGRGHLFCWECFGEAHEPCDCQTWTKWLQKVTEMKPEELAGVTEACEDAANCLWLLTNSKPCPNCKSPIQKNEGCNHMQCAKCKYDFCWICLEEWKKHSSSTGGYYRCTRYEVIQQLEEQSKELTAEVERKHKSYQELDRFMHYYTRYKNHEHSYELERRLLKSAKEKMEQLSRAYAGAEGDTPDTTFIELAVRELLKARRVLKCSYPYGFFLEPKSTKKEIFELMQTDLEIVTEDLAQKVNRPYLRTPRHRIIRAACLVQQKRQEFLASVARGVAPSDSPVTSRRSFTGAEWDWESLGLVSPQTPRSQSDLGVSVQRGRGPNARSQRQGFAEMQQRRRSRFRRHADAAGLRGEAPSPAELMDSPSDPRSASRRHGTRGALSSLDEDDPNMLLAIQLSLQESGLPLSGESQESISGQASLAAIDPSLASRLDPVAHGVETPCAVISSSGLQEWGKGATRPASVTSRYANPECASDQNPSWRTSALSTSTGSKPTSVNADVITNPLGNGADRQSDELGLTHSPKVGDVAEPQRVPTLPPEDEQGSARPTLLESVGMDANAMLLVPPEDRSVRSSTDSGHTDASGCDSGSSLQPNSAKFGLEEQVHLV
ncbi:ankyrin repeat and IBR domain-containing protein 1-like isoform X2 [Paramormyrops kingsleyae]|uniref:ankyrin repeat and IBR domain-containing protein 1-like isoform X2 n=1 Tax=Paramormyrops kingsleyae TaxID=1676925 RepID=UPI000CD6685B|nr:ankyrin repeat and IBR domain-containing protein 1-like isoform X2 [Paramormyrops kingsleyae]